LVRISFIIPLYNCLPLTQVMLASLRATTPPALAHEIILIDDGSTDGTRDWLTTLEAPPCRVLLNERNFGYAVSNNRAAAVATGEFLVLLNNDLILQPGWLEPMLDAHQILGADAGLVGNVQRNARTGEVDHAGLLIDITGKPTHARTLPPTRSPETQAIRPGLAVTGACLLIERALWHELGGFDEGYINGGEDIDLCFRARAAGRVNVVALRSSVRHHVSSSPGRKDCDEQNSYRLAQKWRHEFIAAADHGVRTWCRECLASNWREPRSEVYGTVLSAAMFLAGLRRRPPRAALAGVEAGMARELARWQAMFP
jgi:O-antigen biosynthesis protein